MILIANILPKALLQSRFGSTVDMAASVVSYWLSDRGCSSLCKLRKMNFLKHETKSNHSFHLRLAANKQISIIDLPHQNKRRSSLPDSWTDAEVVTPKTARRELRGWRQRSLRRSGSQDSRKLCLQS